ncbi:hypothetical protein ACA910_000102 [Epithemia clementina (nom. ined.)]
MAMILMAHALCQVQDHTGQVIELDPPADLPKDVNYNPSVDRLECFPNGCFAWTVTDCFAVHCVGSRACKDALLFNNGGVNCRGVAACEGAQLQDIPTIVCVGEDTVLNVCHGARLEATAQVICLGPNACGSPEIYLKDPTDIVLRGPDAVVRCGGGQGKPSCQNLMIHIHHGRRACLTLPADRLTPEELEEQRHCAVICDNGTTECDPETIEFKVYPEEEGDDNLHNNNNNNNTPENNNENNSLENNDENNPENNGA